VPLLCHLADVVIRPYGDRGSPKRGVLPDPQVPIMESQMTFLDCPAYLDEDGAQRCGLPAEVTAWVTTGSTSGPIESVKICCPSGHRFNGPIEFLTVPAGHGTKTAVTITYRA
jgi:hypothetical protein